MCETHFTDFIIRNIVEGSDCSSCFIYISIIVDLSSDMEEIEVGPECVFQEMGMLVLESRVPQSSAKGHVEGPHCPSALGENIKHHCDLEQRNVSDN